MTQEWYMVCDEPMRRQDTWTTIIIRVNCLFLCFRVFSSDPSVSTIRYTSVLSFSPFDCKNRWWISWNHCWSTIGFHFKGFIRIPVKSMYVSQIFNGFFFFHKIKDWSSSTYLVVQSVHLMDIGLSSSSLSNVILLRYYNVILFMRYSLRWRDGYYESQDGQLQG